MKKYRESIIALVLLSSVLLFMLLGLFWWLSPIKIPDHGIWYCKKLNTTINFEKSPNTMTRVLDGIEQSFRIECAYSGTVYYYGTNDKRQVFGRICKELIELPDTFLFSLQNTNKKYIFTRIE